MLIVFDVVQVGHIQRGEKRKFLEHFEVSNKYSTLNFNLRLTFLGNYIIMYLQEYSQYYFFLDIYELRIAIFIHIDLPYQRQFLNKIIWFLLCKVM